MLAKSSGSRRAILFSGQGVKTEAIIDFGRWFLKNGSDDIALARLAAASRRLDPTGKLDLAKALQLGWEQILSQPVNSQVLIYTLEMIAWSLLADSPWIKPSYVAGHSLGEYAALTVSGVFTFEQGLELVKTRARAMAEITGGSMTAVIGLGPEAVQECLASHQTDRPKVWVANHNTTGQVVISGDRDNILRSLDSLLEAGARSFLEVPGCGPFHTPLMRPAAEALRRALAEMPLGGTSISVLGNTIIGPYSDPEQVRKILPSQTVNPVLWAESMDWLASQGVNDLLVIGPGEALVGMTKRNFRGQPVSIMSFQELFT